MIPKRVQIVCLSVGDAPNLYVEKLLSMLARHMPVPFDLTCVMDRPRGLPSTVRTIDASAWPPPREGMRATTYKLGLYDRNRVPFDEFLYLDTTLVIRNDMTPLLEYAFGRSEPLVIVRDWHYDAFNTCVMRIRSGGGLEAIPEAYATGARYDQRIPGDQDFATAVIRERGWEDRVATFPEGMIQSYKAARRAAKRSRSLGKALLDGAIVVKFHGEPKMDQLLDPRYRLRRAIQERKPWHRDAWFGVREIRRHWR